MWPGGGGNLEGISGQTFNTKTYTHPAGVRYPSSLLLPLPLPHPFLLLTRDLRVQYSLLKILGC